MTDITEKLPRSITIDGVEYPVNTDFRIMAEFEKKITAADISDRKEFVKIFIDVISKLFQKIPHADIDKIISGVMWFYRCGEDTENKSGDPSRAKRCYDYKEDANYIYAAFAQQYGDDLVNSKMHWWEFRAKFIGLTDYTEFVRIMQYRCTDISKIKNKDEKARLKRLQERYALKENRIKFANAAHRQLDMRERLKKRFETAEKGKKNG